MIIPYGQRHVIIAAPRFSANSLRSETRNNSCLRFSANSLRSKTCNNSCLHFSANPLQSKTCNNSCLRFSVNSLRSKTCNNSCRRNIKRWSSLEDGTIKVTYFQQIIVPAFICYGKKRVITIASAFTFSALIPYNHLIISALFFSNNLALWQYIRRFGADSLRLETCSKSCLAFWPSIAAALSFSRTVDDFGATLRRLFPMVQNT